MTIDEKYMWRCLQLALKGKGYVTPNPMVGAVVVHHDIIIGEGYHRIYGKSHAEVNAINAVKDKALLADSTLYVSLEPCSHHGKTPPCAELIIRHGIPRVVVACADPYPAVSGQGIEMLRAAGIDVELGVLECESKELNKEFFTGQIQNRPYVYLKWAQSNDGFIDKIREKNIDDPAKLSNDFTQICVHKLRAQVDAIMIGTETAIKDNPRLTTRHWKGRNPIRIILDRNGRVPRGSHLFDNEVETLVLTEAVEDEVCEGELCYIPIRFDENLFSNILETLGKRKIYSIMVEGGRQLLQGIIDQQMWDEAFVEVANIELKNGVQSPNIHGVVLDKINYYDALQIHLKAH